MPLIDSHATDLSPPFGGNTGKSVTRGIVNDAVASGVTLCHSLRGPTSEEGPLTEISKVAAISTVEIVCVVGTVTAIGDIKAA